MITKDGGSTWQDVSLAEDIVLYGVRFAYRERGWMVGEFGQIFHTEDGGKTWTPIPAVVDKSLFCLSMDEGSF